ncbi:MAG: hypothetical protein ACRDL7_02780 [Gaiellaceae bacterium]
MKRIWLTTLVALLGSTMLCAIDAHADATVASPQQAKQTVVVRDVHTQSDVVSGVVSNQSTHLVRDVGLLIRHTWMWNNERHPGSDSPGRAGFYSVAGPIAPGGSAAFTYRPTEPLPARSDGHFVTTVEVVAFTETENTAASR